MVVAIGVARGLGHVFLEHDPGDALIELGRGVVVKMDRR
jgi:hypothetical protein